MFLLIKKGRKKCNHNYLNLKKKERKKNRKGAETWNGDKFVI